MSFCCEEMNLAVELSPRNSSGLKVKEVRTGATGHLRSATMCYVVSTGLPLVPIHYCPFCGADYNSELHIPTELTKELVSALQEINSSPTVESVERFEDVFGSLVNLILKKASEEAKRVACSL